MSKKCADATEPLTAKEFFERERGGINLLAFSRETGVPASTLYRNVVNGLPIRHATARKLEVWSGGRISAAKMAERGEIS